MVYPEYWRKLKLTEDQTSHGAEQTRRVAADRALREVKEIVKQVNQDRKGLMTDHRAVKRHWEEEVIEEEEPRVDLNKAARERYWWVGAVLMFTIEAAWASWLTTTYLELATVSPAWRPALLIGIGIVVTLVVTLLFSKAMATGDDDLRPVPSLQHFGRRAAFFSMFGIVAVAAFLLTRQYVVGGIVLQVSLAILTLCLAAGVAASIHCALILRRPNRLARKYDELDKLLGRAEIIKDSLEDLTGDATPTPTPPEPVQQPGVRRFSSGAPDPGSRE
ncbi:MAG TPA: hypothetical protein VNJ70_06055 [Thermoanaerobaculia bacterium]|nr:hypothetical protein [Thermoanaerobaculia bacterium]